MATKEEILDAISGMTVLELSELLSAFEERFGVTAAAPVAVAGPGPAAGGGGDGAAPAEEEQDEFDVILASSGAPAHRSRTSSPAGPAAPSSRGLEGDDGGGGRHVERLDAPGEGDRPPGVDPLGHGGAEARRLVAEHVGRPG